MTIAARTERAEIMSSDVLQPGPIASGVSIDAPDIRVAAVLMEIWQELLHIPQVEPTDDFFELGGDSLGAIRMLERIGREFGEELLEPDIIYTASSFNDLVAAISTALLERDEQVSNIPS